MNYNANQPPPAEEREQQTASSSRPSPKIEITVFAKDHGPLTKRISLGLDGKIVSDSSACTMARGVARRARFDTLNDLAKLIDGLRSNEAIGLGALRNGLLDNVAIVTKAKLNSGGGAIARTAENFVFEPGQPALVLFDYDTKGMPREVAKLIAERGGFWGALTSVVPALATAGHLIRASTSSGIARADTGETFPGSGGLHGFVRIKDGSDVERLVSTLHDRCWLAGLGWTIVGGGGQLLERSIVDCTVGKPERLVFEGPPIVELPLRQDTVARRPTVVDGDVLDSIAACKPLTVVEKQTIKRLRAQAAVSLSAEVKKARDLFIARQTERLMRRTGMSAGAAAAVIEKQTRGILLASIELLFDDPDLQGRCVGDVLDDPARFDGETLADPVEREGRCGVKVMLGSDGVFIHSFAHGGAVYQLRYDAAAIKSRIAASTDPVGTFIKLALLADINDIEITELANDAARRSGVGVRDIKATLKVALKEQKKRQKEEMLQRLLAERGDPRPILQRPPGDAEWIPVISDINEVVAKAEAERQSRRDIDGTIAQERLMPISETHAFTSANEEDDPQ